MRRALIAVLVLIGLGAGVYVYTRPSADIDGIRSAATRGFATSNRRDRAVKLSVPKETRDELARSGVRAEVLFVPLQRSGGYGAYTRESDLDRGSTTMPAKAEGEIVHVFRVDRCRPGGTWISPSYALDVDGHTARVDVAVTSDHHELWTWDRDVTDEFGNLQIGGCG